VDLLKHIIAEAKCKTAHGYSQRVLDVCKELIPHVHTALCAMPDKTWQGKVRELKGHFFPDGCPGEAAKQPPVSESSKLASDATALGIPLVWNRATQSQEDHRKELVKFIRAFRQDKIGVLKGRKFLWPKRVTKEQASFAFKLALQWTKDHDGDNKFIQEFIFDLRMAMRHDAPQAPEEAVPQPQPPMQEQGIVAAQHEPHSARDAGEIGAGVSSAQVIVAQDVAVGASGKEGANSNAL